MQLKATANNHFELSWNLVELSFRTGASLPKTCAATCFHLKAAKRAVSL
jgi:hypothetical protein